VSKRHHSPPLQDQQQEDRHDQAVHRLQRAVPLAQVEHPLLAALHGQVVPLQHQEDRLDQEAHPGPVVPHGPEHKLYTTRIVLCSCLFPSLTH
jgi:hypothetical protein